MDKNWLQRRVTVEEAEQQNMILDDRLGRKAVPFGFMNEKWKAFIAQMVEGDQLWEFISPPDTWQNLCGRQGIAIVRNGEVLSTLVTEMN
jgi:hypothetical protein